uniref:Uncharacterized protein n=1 Tax=Romanomermis culicivorax TaxID=13658 RepID=A0A915K0C2_ROMCU
MHNHAILARLYHQQPGLTSLQTVAVQEFLVAVMLPLSDEQLAEIQQAFIQNYNSNNYHFELMQSQHGPFARYGTLLMAKLQWEVDMQIKKMEEQGCRHLHRSLALQKEENDNLIFRLEQRAKGLGATLADVRLQEDLFRDPVRQGLVRIWQEQERLQQLERAPEMFNQELEMQLCALKGTIEALFDIIAKVPQRTIREFERQKELQKQYQQMQQFQQQAPLQQPQLTEDYNIKRVIGVHEPDQWFKETFGYWPANPKEPILVDMGKVSQLLKYI